MEGQRIIHIAPGMRILISLAAVVLIFGGLQLAADLLIPVMLAFFFAVLFMPITRWLELRRVPHSLAVFVTVLIGVAVVVGIVLIAIGLISDFQSKAGEYAGKLRRLVENFLTYLESRGVKDAHEFVPFYSTPMESALKFINEQNVFQRVTSLLKTSFFVFVVTVFVLTESGATGNRVANIVKADGPNFERFRRASRDIQKYLGVKTVISAVTGVLAGVLCWVLGIEFPLLWGILAFVLNYIPAIGSVIAGLPPVMVALVQYPDKHWLSVVVLTGYLTINGVLGNFVEPAILGKRFGISTLVVILSVLVWGWVWGPVGMFLAVPLTMMLKVMFANTEDFRWLSVAMGKKGEDESERDVSKRSEKRGSEDSGIPDNSGKVIGQG